MLFGSIKALHIIFVVTWFAGLFYIVRLFIYNAEAETKDPSERQILQNQYKIMQRRLWFGITWPSAVITLVLGLWLLSYYSPIPGWLWLKLSFLLPLYLYHLSCHLIYNQQKLDNFKYTPFQLRIWNEVATLFLFAIVFTVSLKNFISWYVVLIGLILLAGLLFLSIKIYAKKRANSKNEDQS